jgi:Trp operon repressor
MEGDKKELLKIIIGIKKLKFLEKFLRDLLTPVEFKEIIKRWQVVKELSKKTHQWEISQKLKVGRATITRGARVLYNKNSAFKKILEKK